MRYPAFAFLICFSVCSFGMWQQPSDDEETDFDSEMVTDVKNLCPSLFSDTTVQQNIKKISVPRLLYRELIPTLYANHLETIEKEGAAQKGMADIFYSFMSTIDTTKETELFSNLAAATFNRVAPWKADYFLASIIKAWLSIMEHENREEDSNLNTMYQQAEQILNEVQKCTNQKTMKRLEEVVTTALPMNYYDLSVVNRKIEPQYPLLTKTQIEQAKIQERSLNLAKHVQPYIPYNFSTLKKSTTKKQQRKDFLQNLNSGLKAAALMYPQKDFPHYHESLLEKAKIISSEIFFPNFVMPPIGVRDSFSFADLSTVLNEAINSDSDSLAGGSLLVVSLVSLNNQCENCQDNQSQRIHCFLTSCLQKIFEQIPRNYHDICFAATGIYPSHITETRPSYTQAAPSYASQGSTINSKCSDKVLLEVARNMSTEMWQLAVHLGIKNSTVAEISADNRGSVGATNFKILKSWSNNGGLKMSLSQALKNCGNSKLACEIEKML
ncbi:hypothetical protein CI610_00870 [invertebrate metagenome]|uniref:Death domain-containing protein n=1 Tax=invertebrate metagenome TaxID=1711999 RepID=A0A2H9TA57_9ZZZZ